MDSRQHKAPPVSRATAAAGEREIVGTNLRGDRGQYFTPRGAIKLVVAMLDPKPNEYSSLSHVLIRLGHAAFRSRAGESDMEQRRRRAPASGLAPLLKPTSPQIKRPI